MFAHITDVLLSTQGIQFQRYPFRPSSIYPARQLAWSMIQEIVVNAAPPEIRTKQGEVLFIPATQTDSLVTAAHAHAIPVVKRVDLWDLILEPFVDTVYSEAQQQQTLSTLAAHGIDYAACVELRRTVGGRMLAYNAVLWDWVHLGQYDLLLAHHSFTKRGHFETLYWHSMDIAIRAKQIDET